MSYQVIALALHPNKYLILNIKTCSIFLFNKINIIVSALLLYDDIFNEGRPIFREPSYNMNVYLFREIPPTQQKTLYTTDVHLFGKNLHS